MFDKLSTELNEVMSYGCTCDKIEFASWFSFTFNIIQGAKSPLVHCIMYKQLVFSAVAISKNCTKTIYFYIINGSSLPFWKVLLWKTRDCCGSLRGLGTLSVTRSDFAAHTLSLPPLTGKQKAFQRASCLRHIARTAHCTVHTAYFVHFANCRLHNIDTRHCNTH